MRAMTAVLALAYTADRPLARRLIALHVLGVVNVGLVAVALKLLVDAAAARDATGATVGAAIGILALSAAVVLFPLGAVISLTLTERTGAALDRRLIELSTGFPTLDVHDRTEFSEKLQLLAHDDRYPITSSVAVVFGLSTYALLIAATATVLAMQNAVLALTPLAIFPMFWLGWRTEQMWNRAQQETAADQRLAEALFRLATTPEAGKELRVFGTGDELLRRHASAQQRVTARLSRASRAASAIQATSWLAFGILLGVTVLVVTERAIEGRASAGDVILVLSLSVAIVLIAQSSGPQIFALSRLTSAGQRLLWMKAQADTAHRKHGVPDELRSGIRLEGVGLTYAGTDGPVLQEVDLSFRPGSVVALVGDNGVGKSTLVKLLSGLYRPTMGRIFIDDVSMEDINLAAWRARICATFQDFVQFDFLASETVGVGDLPHLGDAQARESAVDAAGARPVLDALSDGWLTQLGRSWTDGAELSTGQWQKLALSRGLMRTRPLLIVLDEPTSALDPMAEHKLFEQFSRLSRQARSTSAVTIIVSHRFSTARLADLIVVVDQGRIAASGTHEELLAQNGLYSELYEIQADSYR